MRKYYVLIDGLNGPVTVDAFKNCIELESFSLPAISGSSGDDGTVRHEPLVLHLMSQEMDNYGDIKNTLRKYSHDRQVLKQVTVYEALRINGATDMRLKVVYTDPRVIYSDDYRIVMDRFITVEETRYVIDKDGNKKPNVVTYDLEKDGTE